MAKEMQFAEKSTNTLNSFINENHKNESNQTSNNVSLEESTVGNNKSTSTDDLVSTLNLGYFSKSQLMSAKSLFEKRSDLIEACTTMYESDTEDCPGLGGKHHYTIPIQICLDNIPKSSSTGQGQKKFSFRRRFETNNINPNKVVKTITNSLFGKSVIEDDDKLARLLKIGPKRSSEWTMFKKKKGDDNEDKLIKKKTITTTTTTTTTVTKVVESTLIDYKDQTFFDKDDDMQIVQQSSSKLVNQSDSSLNNSLVSSFVSQPNLSDDQIILSD